MVLLWMLGSVKNRWSSLPLHTVALETVVSISFALKTKRHRNILNIPTSLRNLPVLISDGKSSGRQLDECTASDRTGGPLLTKSRNLEILLTKCLISIEISSKFQISSKF